ncbi:MAG: hypothetical protein KF724_06695 [Phycisphaeraceae bacterium]|nr:hypothetical protein [Phycisphaeraceae bacterium]
MNPLLLLAVGAASDGASEERWLILGFILLAVGIVLFAAELFIPSGGLLATLCGLSLVASVACFFMHDWRWGIAAASIYAAGAPAVIVFGLKVWSASPLARKMILEDAVDAEADRPPSLRPNALRLEQLRKLIGAEGDVVTPLRPVGFVRIAGQRVDALAESGFIDAGQRVVVVDVLDDQIKVRAVG